MEGGPSASELGIDLKAQAGKQTPKKAAVDDVIKAKPETTTPPAQADQETKQSPQQVIEQADLNEPRKTLEALADLQVDDKDQTTEQVETAPVSDQKEAPEDSPINIESYSENVESNREKAKGVARKAELVAEMRQTREILDADHPFNQTVQKIVARLQSDRNFDVVISLSDTEKRVTLLGADTHIISAGSISKFEAYLKERGRPLTEDHLAMLIAHEMAHGDPEAKRAYLNEKYCDTQGLSLVDNAGFNLQSAIETLEFFEDSTRKPDKKEGEDKGSRWDERKSFIATEKSEQDEGGENGDIEVKEHRGSSNTENRRILGHLIANDSTIHLNGRYAQETPLSTDYSDFKNKAEQWLSQAETRNGIASEADVVREFENCQNISEVLETFLSTENFNHSTISQQFANSKEFERLLLAAAVYRGFTGEHLRLLDKRDFLTQARSDGMKKPQVEAIVLKGDQPPINESRRFEGYNFRDAERTVIADVLNGKYENPLEVFTLSDDELAAKYPELKNARVGDFISELRAGTKDYAKILKKDFQDATVQDLLEGTKVALASAYIRSAEGMRDTSDRGDDILRHNIPAIATLTDRLDYDHINSLIQQSLIRSGSCRTPQSAQIIADTFIRSGYYVPEMYYDVHKIKGKYTRSLPAQEELTPEVFQDLRENMFSVNFGLTGGGERSNKGYVDPVLMDNFIARLGGLYQGRKGYNEPGVGMYGNPHFELIGLLDSTAPSVGSPHGHKNLDLISSFLRNPDASITGEAKKDFRRAKKGDLALSPDKYYETYKARYTLSPKFNGEQVQGLVLDSVNRRSDLVGAFLTSEYSKDPKFVRGVIQRGMQEQKLTPGEIEAMLLKWACRRIRLVAS